MVNPLVWLARMERGLRRSADAVRDVAGGFLGTALTPEERAEVGATLYDARLDQVRRGLPDWEQDWLLTDLPPTPAHVLIGGCGDGREARWLRERGYDVTGFDPGPAAVQRFAEHGTGWVGSYESLARVVLGDRESGDPRSGTPSSLGFAAIGSRRFDAILCGWCSLNHVVSSDERQRVFRALNQLCPSGPILLTVYPSGFAMPHGRAFRAARRAGQQVGTLRKGAFIAAAPDEAFDLRAGFLKGWTQDEIRAVAAGCGRSALFRGYDESCWRYTLTPLLAS